MSDNKSILIAAGIILGVVMIMWDLLPYTKINPFNLEYDFSSPIKCTGEQGLCSTITEIWCRDPKKTIKIDMSPSLRTATLKCGE
jgi:hypothetical protein